jgi:hypothetical protein
MTLRLTLALMLIATPLLAPAPLRAEGNIDPAAPARPGAVALYLSAKTLSDLGQAAKDPLMVLTAAQILRGLTLTDTPRSPDPAPATPTPLSALDPTTLFDTARTLDAGENYTDLIEFVARQTGPAPRALNATASALNPAGFETWTLTFYGGAYAEVAIIGHGNGNLDLLVTDDGGTIICQDRGSGDGAICGFTPAENGAFTVTVTNPGATPDGYILLTN